jgi:hypothetical protein
MREDILWTMVGWGVDCVLDGVDVHVGITTYASRLGRFGSVVIYCVLGARLRNHSKVKSQPIR